MQQSLEDQLKHLIVDALALEDVEPGEIQTEAPLFVEGLGLDSIDALELALAIQEKFGVATSPDDERNREIFFSVKTLAEFVRAHQAGGGPAVAAEPA
ncbi:MAG: acyl carrier protein [Deltaproteobacteria bacterium]|nr:acyl carrier protein [Deltaproteobacteria bacterium]